MIPFVVIFLLIGIGLVVAGRGLEENAVRARGWPVTAGRLEYCEVVEVPGIQVEDVSSWQLRLRYSYSVGGVSYHSDRYAFGYGDGRDDQKHRVIAEALQRQTQLSVRYDPTHPSEAVLSTEAPSNVTSLGYFMLVMAVISAFLAWVF